MINIKDIAGRLGRLNEKEEVSAPEECGGSVCRSTQEKLNCHTSLNAGGKNGSAVYVRQTISGVADQFFVTRRIGSRLQTVERTT
ncbi:MAG: hypothetical protein RI101_13965 [Nitrospira sp.]|jgi:hypothetical protein|nr:hypothetical protein [Nitrospira sp.]